MYSQTCIERSSSGDGVPQNKSNIKNNKNAILCHNWSLYAQKLVKNTIKIKFGRETWITFYSKNNF